MGAFEAFLSNYGNLGMFLAALLSGSILPISSEAIMIALLAVGIEPWGLLLWGTLGNIIGGVICYYAGSRGTPEQLARVLHIRNERMDKAVAVIQKYGWWAAFFSFVPLLGSAILIAMGVMHSDVPRTMVSMILGKFLRYFVIVLSAVGITLIFTH